MEGSTGLSYFSARMEIIERFPDLRQKIESKVFYNNDINRIARTIFIKEEDDKTVSIENASYNKNEAVPASQIEIIRRILKYEQPVNTEVRIVRGRKQKNIGAQEEDSTTNRQHETLEMESTSKAGQGTKRKRKTEVEDITPPFEKKIKLEETRNLEDFFSKMSGLPVNLMSLTAEYIGDETRDLIIEFAEKDPDNIPQYLKENVTDLDLTGLDFKTFLIIIKEFKNLKSITLHYADDRHLEELCKTLPNLVSLEVHDSYGITVDGFSCIPSLIALKKLKLENLGYPEEWDNPGERVENAVKSAVKGCANIETLQLVGLCIGKNALEFVSQECPNLKYLEISFLTYISKDGVNSIFRSSPDLLEIKLSGRGLDDSVLDCISNYCHKLVKLDVEFNKFLGSEPDITDEGLKNMSMRCSSLIDIKLTSCKGLTDEGILNLTQGIKSLQRLSLYNCYNITSTGVGYISKWRESLKSIEIVECKAIGQGIFTHFVESLPMIERLELGFIEITNDDLYNLKNLFPSLNSLILLGCRKITGNVLFNLKEIQNLKNLRMEYQCKITKNCFQQLFEFPLLRNLIMDFEGVSAQEIDDLRNRGIRVSSNLSRDYDLDFDLL